MASTDIPHPRDKGAESLRRRLHRIVEAGIDRRPVQRAYDAFLMGLIFANVCAVALETVESLSNAYHSYFNAFEIFSVAVFTVEYAVRVWVAVEDSRRRYRHPLWGRLKYMITPMALIDLLAIAPFFLQAVFAIDLRALRVLRLLRVLKLTRYAGALDTLLRVLYEERQPLLAAFSIMMILLVFLSGIVYFLEHEAQPKSFASIPHAMWWGMATLTTVGYGDIVPVTPMGKVVGGLVTLIGLGMFALPAAILGSGFARVAKERDFLVTWNLVAQVPLFSHLPAASIAGIAGLLKPRVAVPREMIIRKGDRATGMFFIVSGEAEVELEPYPARLTQGEYFGEVALLRHRPRVATVTAVTSCQLLFLDAREFHELLREHPDLGREIHRVAEERTGHPLELEEKAPADAASGR